MPDQKRRQLAPDDVKFAHAEAAYKAYCRELHSGSQRLTAEARQIVAPVAWEWLTTIERSAWLEGVKAAVEAFAGEDASEGQDA